MDINPIIMSLTLLPLLFFVLIFLTYLNVIETKRTKSLDNKMGEMIEYVKLIADKIAGTPEKSE